MVILGIAILLVVMMIMVKDPGGALRGVSDAKIISLMCIFLIVALTLIMLIRG